MKLAVSVLTALAVMLASGLAIAAQSPPPTETVPPRVKQILPRGGIPAITAPVFVKATEAEIPSDAWVLGVVVEGQARAYSLNLLNRHEVVNDQAGGTPFAAVW